MGQVIERRGEWILLLITAIWGTTFVALQALLQVWPPNWLMTARFFIASIVVLPFVFKNPWHRQTLRDGILMGFFAFIGFALQTISLQYTTAAHAAFGTSLVTIFVPLLSNFFWRTPWQLGTVIALILAALGIVLLFGGTLESGVRIGDFLAIACALAFAVQIMMLQVSARRSPHWHLAFTMLLTITCLSAGVSLWQGETWPTLLWHSMPVLLYLSIVATAGCLVGQVYGQDLVNATRAAFIYALEPIFAAVFAWVLYNANLTYVECLGGGLVVVAALVADRPMPAFVGDFIKRF